MKSPLLLLASLALVAVTAGCDASVKIDPTGYRCDVGNVCPTGFSCVDSTCQRSGTVDTSCANVVCNSPPASACDGNSLQTFVGRCVSGQCMYDAVTMACASTCANGACVDPCATVSCVTPPAPACADANTLSTFAQTGTCSNGQCAYTRTDTACPNGCDNGKCSGADLCRSMNVVCNMPPMTTCVGTTRRTFAMTGTCEPGTGACTYTSSDMVCPSGCSLGQCVAPSLTYAQVGPRVRFPINALDVAPGSSGNSALAVGDNGKMARWDGSTWTELTSTSTSKLNSVAFVSGTIAYAVGERSTALTVRPASNAIAPVSLSGGGNLNLIGVSGRSESEVMIASSTGEWWRQRGGTWANGSLPNTSGTLAMVAAYMDESQRERIVGRCGSNRCTAYRNASGGTPMWTIQTQSGSTGFSAVGGAFDIPSSTTGSIAMLGASLDLVTHDTTFLTTNPYSTVTLNSSLGGSSVVGITAQAVTVGRDVYALTSSVGSATGHLYRLSRTVGVSVNDALQTYYGEEHLSPNDANGVLVAEVRRTSGVNNVFRRSVITNETLDVGEDLVGASADGAGNLYFVSDYGDVIIRRTGSATFEFRRPPAYDWAISGAEARNGTGVLLVGEDVTTNEGIITRFSGTSFTSITAAMGESFNAVCRVSDTEAWAVGAGGAIFRINGTTATKQTTPTTNDLLAVDCAAGVAVACGKSGTVLRFSNNAWTSVSSGLNATGDVHTCKLTAAGGLVGGDGFLALYNGGTWTPLAGQMGLRSLVVRGPLEVYGAFVSGSTSTISRFDGSTWSPSLLSVTGVLGGGVQVGGRVVWGGSLGAIVEGR